MKVLTPEAERELGQFEADYGELGCVCFTGCAPCGWCTHPGNPLNQAEDETAWVEEPVPPDCDCRQPAPVRSRPLSECYLECAGCRGKVGHSRIISERLTVRE